MTLDRSIGRTLLVAALMFCAAGEVHAQRAALVQDVDEAARTPYQEQISCFYNGSNICRFTFKQVPVGRRREIKVVSCYAQNNSVNPLYFQAVSLFNTIPPRIEVRIPTQSQLPGFPFNGEAYAQTSMYFEPGDTPFIQLSLKEAIGGASCSVIGRDIVLP